ncbi:35044_t:CDS:2, partial [Racocetra persica]
NFCDRYCQGFYENQESHRKLRMDIWNGKETRDYEAVEKELKEKPLNDQRLQIIRKIHAYMIKKSREFLYCFAPKCSKRFEVTSQTFSSEEQEKTEKWYKEHEIKVKEIKERSLLRAYGYSSQEDLSNFRKLFGGE